MIIAIDPGASGGIAVMHDDGTIEAVPMPDTDRDIVDTIDMAIAAPSFKGDRRAVIEKVSGYVGEGQPGSAMFNFGDNVGFVRGVLMAHMFRIERPTPQSWIKTLGLGTREHAKFDKKAFVSATKEQIAKEKKRIAKLNAKYKQDWKNKLKAKAQELFPDQKVTLKTADALLILEAARRTPF